MFSKTLSLDITRPYNLLIPENRKSERLRQPPKHNLYNRAQVTRTLKGNEKQFELAGGLFCQLTCIKSPKATEVDCLIVITFLVFYFQNASDFSFLIKYVILHGQ